MKLDFCCACGSTENLHQHHLMPRSLGGTDDETNLITLCGECHGVIHGLRKTTWVNHSELTKAGLERAKARGKKVGGDNFQIDKMVEGKKKAAQDRAERYRAELTMMRKHGYSLKAMAESLNQRGIRTPTGKQFYANTVVNLIKRLGL